MSKPLVKIKPGDISINNVSITMSCLFPLDFIQLLKTFNDAGYEAQAPIQTGETRLIRERINIVDTENFKLEYQTNNKVLELLSNDEYIIESFNEVNDVLTESHYNIRRNIIYYELIWRVQNVYSTSWTERLETIESPMFDELSSKFGMEQIIPHGIFLASNRDAITKNWFGIRISPVHQLGKDFYNFEIVCRKENLEEFLEPIKIMQEIVEKYLRK